eukprot:COSAG06_NODE_8398_length_2187_cov_2.305077_1_plen_155_part_00
MPTHARAQMASPVIFFNVDGVDQHNLAQGGQLVDKSPDQFTDIVLLDECIDGTISNRRSGGDGGRFAPRAIGAPAGMESALTDGEAPFLNPRPRRLQPVPLEFGTVGEWCSHMAHNLLAEFWHIYREGSNAPSLRARVLGGKHVYYYLWPIYFG